MLRTGLEDTFYLPGGERAKGNGELIAALADCTRKAGRSVASPAEARDLLGLRDSCRRPAYRTVHRRANRRAKLIST